MIPDFVCLAVAGGVRTVSSRTIGSFQVIAYEDTQANLTLWDTKGGDATVLEKWKGIMTK
jgi:hypothetical protein